MQVFLSLVPQILLLYFVIFLGFFSSKHLSVNKDGISNLSIYVLVPMVMFYGVMKSEFSISVIFIPFIVMGISTINCLLTLKFGKFYLSEDNAIRIISLAAGTANVGYFGVPVAMILFDPETVGLYIVAILGTTLFQNSIGFYITARGKSSAKESLMKVLKIPVIYAFLLAVILKSIGIERTPEFLVPFLDNVLGCYIIIGMMIVGSSIAFMEKLKFDWKFISLSFFVRFVSWPAIAFLIYYLDSLSLHIFDADFGKCLILAAIVPLPADSVAIANILKCHPNKMATSVILSNILGIFYVPLMASILLV